MKKFKNLLYLIIITIIFFIINYKLFKNVSFLIVPLSIFEWITRIIYLCCTSLFGINFYYDMIEFGKNKQNLKRNYKGFYIIILSLIINLIYSLLFGRDTLLGYNLNSKNLFEGICDLMTLLLYLHGIKIQIKYLLYYEKKLNKL